MNGHTIISISALCISLLAGCGSDQLESPRGLAEAMPEANSLSGPCTIVLAPHEGKDRLDWEIMRRQRQARDATNPVPYLDRLGWALVAKARASSDPGFYKLAEQAAWCIEAKRPGSTEALLLSGHVLHNLHRFKERKPWPAGWSPSAGCGLTTDYWAIC
jgi:hypothetical protein